MKAAPPRDAAEPADETPPEVPGGTRRRDTIERGSPPRRVPTSVAQVSAVDAASAPMATVGHTADGEAMNATAAAAKSPPFASTCHASLAPLLATIESTSRALRFAPIRDNALLEKKNARRRIAQLQPAHNARVPTSTAAMDPSADSAPLR